jgi:hypothetical protein
VTFTLPDALRALARAQPKVVYGVLMRAAAAALLTLTADPRYLGAARHPRRAPHLDARPALVS